MKIHVILLAAGNSRRFGTNKLLFEYEGKPMYRHVIDMLDGVDHSLLGVFVLVSQYEELLGEGMRRGYHCVSNQKPELGISHSIHLALKELQRSEGYEAGDAAMFMVCDQPELKKETAENFIKLYQASGKGIGCVRAEERLGNPVIFSDRYFPELFMLTGDIGGKQVLKRHMEDVITYDVARSEELNDMDYQPHHKTLVIVRGGGDIATGTIYELHKKGYRLLSLEVAKPSCIRRQVSFGEAVYDRVSVVDGVTSVFVSTEEEMQEAWSRQQVPVVIDPKGMWIERLKPEVVVDAILAKRNLGTQKEMAPLVIGLGPGFEAGNDVDAVVETMRGERLGKIYYEGTALPNTGVPGVIAGYAKERVIHAPEAGRFVPIKEVGALVEKGETIAKIGDSDVYATMPGFLRGMIRPGYEVDKGLKIMDIEPRLSERERCFHISDKAAKIGVSVAEVIEQYENHQGE